MTPDFEVQFFVAETYRTLFPQLKRLIHECVTADESCRNVGLTILCRCAPKLINEGLDAIIGARFCWGTLWTAKHEGDTVINHCIRLRDQLHALLKQTAQQPWQSVTLQCFFDSDSDGSQQLVLRCFNISGAEVDNLVLDPESTVADLKQKWRIDDARFTWENQVRIARDFNAYTYTEFAQHYGLEACEQRWREAWPVYVTAGSCASGSGWSESYESFHCVPHVPPPSQVCILSPAGRLLSDADPGERITAWFGLS